jgi:hypothetical protein
MPANYPMPALDHLRDLLKDLMGRDVDVERTATVDLGGDRPGALADYAADVGGVGVICVADLALTNALGCALTMVAPAAVEDAVARNVIDEPTIENFREVVNVMTGLFNTEHTAHVKFRGVHTLPSSDLPGDTARLLASHRGRRDFDVHVHDYGTGTLSVLIG